jgi:MFS family permease
VTGVLGGIVDRVVPPALGADFQRYLAATWLSNLSDGILLAAGPLLVASQTDSPALVALAVILQRLPWFFFGLGAGIVADRLNRRMLVLLGNGVRVVVLSVLAITIVGEQINIGVALGAMFLLGSAETFTDISTDAMLPMLVPAEHLGVANARAVFGIHALNLLGGPPLGALLFAGAMFLPFAIEAVLLAASLALIVQVRIPNTDRTPSTSALGDLREGVRWLWGSGPVRTLALTVFVFNLTWGATNAIMVLYASENLGLDERGFGLFLAAGAVGGVVGSSLYGTLERRISMGTMMRAGLAYETLAHLGLGLTGRWWVAFPIVFFAGIQTSIWGTLSRAVRQRAVPEAFMGRVGSVYMFGVSTGLVLGGLIGGIVGSIFNLTAVFWYAFAGSAVFLALVWREMPRIAHAGLPS